MRNMFLSEIWSVAQTGQGDAIVLRPRGLDTVVPIFIGDLEMQSILIGRDGVTLPHPLTHDLILNMLSRVNLEIKRVEVYELKDNTFRARIVIVGGEYTSEKPLIFDSRPSDAFALAVRRRYPIFIEATVVEQTGIPLDFFIESMETDDEGAALYIPNPGALQSGEETGGISIGKYQTLVDQLKCAIAQEEYERAAEIRDLLKEMEAEDKD